LGAGCTKDSGINEPFPILVDFVLSFAWFSKPPEQKLEGWGWKRYFENHLQGRIRRRRLIGDDRFTIQYRSILGMTTKALKRDVMWNEYGAKIEATRDAGHDGQCANTCVLLHSDTPALESRFDKRACYLNPQYASKCWFLPVDYPAFPGLPPPPDKGLNICIPASRRNYTNVVQALQTLQPKQHAKIILNGRKGYGRKRAVPEAFIRAGLVDKYVVVNSDTVDYWEFQRLIAYCHVIIPLVENDDGGVSDPYFRGNQTKNFGKLSSFLAQSVGNRIPSVLHSSVVAIYGKELTAPYYEYNSTTDGSGFVVAFRQMLESFVK
jgi:hypothetical protein